MPDAPRAPSSTRREPGISHWRRELGQCEDPALLLDPQFRAVEINLRSRDLGVEPGQDMGAWMALVQSSVRGGANDELCLSYVPVATTGFRGWFVTPCAGRTASRARLQKSLERKLDDAKRRLAGEIRRRQFLERRILAVSGSEHRDGAAESGHP